MLSRTRDQSIKPGELIEITATKKNPAYIAKLNDSKPCSSLYVPTSVIGIWLGYELVDLGIDWVECEVFLYQNSRHVLINGTWKKIS